MRKQKSVTQQSLHGIDCHENIINSHDMRASRQPHLPHIQWEGQASSIQDCLPQSFSNKKPLLRKN